MFADIAASQPIRVLSLRYFNPIGRPQDADRPAVAAPDPLPWAKIIQAYNEGVPFQITGTDWRPGTAPASGTTFTSGTWPPRTSPR